MAGLIDLGNYSRSMAQGAGTKAAELQGNRENEEKMINQAEKNETLQTAGAGLGLGLAAGGSSASMGASFGSAAGPVGMIAGGLLGFALGELV